MGKRIKVGIVGCGAIGSQVALFIDRKLRENYEIVGIYDLDLERAKSLLKKLKMQPRIMEVNQLLKKCELLIEAASILAAKDIIKKAVKRKRILVILSVGVFVKYPRLLSLSQKAGQIYIPSGAISGIDGISALGMGRIKKLRLITSKSPSSLKGISFLNNQGIDVFKIKKDKIVFRGNIKKAIEYFPQNINVAATLFLASQFKNIEVIIRVNPSLKRNIHRIEVDSCDGRLNIEVENLPSIINPKTSVMAILSTKKLLKKMIDNFKIGS